MTLRMLECFRRDTVQIRMSLQPPGDITGESIIGKTGKFYPHLNEFVCLHTQVLNLTGEHLFIVNVQF